MERERERGGGIRRVRRVVGHRKRKKQCRWKWRENAHEQELQLAASIVRERGGGACQRELKCNVGDGDFSSRLGSGQARQATFVNEARGGGDQIGNAGMGGATKT